jgi:MoxR-like ATPase
LVTAVNLAIYLRRPLLLEGEAGCGKTRLARCVAHRLGLPLYEWCIRSTSKAQEGLYTYDAILRLHDVHTGQARAKVHTGHTKGKGKLAAVDQDIQPRDAQNPKHYRTLGALGKAFMERQCPAVVLIDEIDKAEVDFPNDLLTVLEDPWTFHIPETYEKISAAEKCRPIVIITSNKEKGNLPAPFLRRCVYYYLEFPDDAKRLNAIVEAHYQVRKQPAPDSKLVDAAADRFLEVRARDDLFKKPGTSEYLDWVNALHSFQEKPHDPELLKQLDLPLPYPELLFKLRADWRRYAVAT